MNIVEQGTGKLFMNPDPDEARGHFAKKDRVQKYKRMTTKEAVEKFIPDGCYLAVGGFGTNRIPTAVLHEILRAGRKEMGFLGHTSTHDFQLLAAGNCFNRVDAAYVVGMEARGLSPNARQVMQSGNIEVCEWTNHSLAVRLKSASDGSSFGLVRSMMGTDTFKYSAAKIVECPFTGKNMVAVPALWPDVAVIHVHECDVYGNARIKGISIADFELARAAKQLIITTERLVSNMDIRLTPNLTVIPHYLVDAVIVVPYGSYPGNMPYEYFSDEDHLMLWLKSEKDPDKFKEFLDKYIYRISSFEEYLELCGGLKRLTQLREQELLLNA